MSRDQWHQIVSNSPKEWQRTIFGEVFEKREERGQTGLPLLSVTSDKGVVLRDELERRDTSNADKSRYLVVRPGDIVYNTMRMWQSVSGLSKYDGLTSPAYTICRSKGLIDPQYAAYLLKLDPLVRKFHSNSQGIVDDTLSLKFPAFGRIELALPGIDEQHRIAEILSSVDEAIQATQAVIEQTRNVKQVTLKRLLTQGIGHTRFKQTEIGEIPEDWEVQTLEDLLANCDPAMRSGPFGSALKKEELVEDGVPLLGIDNVHVERFEQTYRRFVTPSKFARLKRFAVRPNDVMITIMGTVGRCCVVPDNVGLALSSKHVWTITFDQERYLPELLCWQLNFAPWVLNEFMRTAQGGTMAAINSGVLRSVRLPVPSMPEQRRIADVWSSLQQSLHGQEIMLNRLVATKSALMSDLLTGRKRVLSDLPMAAE